MNCENYNNDIIPIFQYSCVASLGLLIYVNKRPYRCYYTGQILNIQIATNSSYHEGDIVCPSCVAVCGVSDHLVNVFLSDLHGALECHPLSNTHQRHKCLTQNSLARGFCIIHAGRNSGCNHRRWAIGVVVGVDVI